MRLKGKTAIIVGAGQSPGSGLGNGRATCLRFAQEGARLMAVDRELALAEETTALVQKEGGDCFSFEADVTKESAMAAMVAEAKKRWGRIDILHAFRNPSLGMLARAEAVEIEPGLSIRVARVEDIIGLKVQALTNNPARAEGEARRLLTPREYTEFATFASRFDRSRKPVAFDGTHWKL